MSDSQASALALERFEHGIVWHPAHAIPGDSWWCVVGQHLPDGTVKELGYGTTFEDAFEMASEADG